MKSIIVTLGMLIAAESKEAAPLHFNCKLAAGNSVEFSLDHKGGSTAAVFDLRTGNTWVWSAMFNIDGASFRGGSYDYKSRNLLISLPGEKPSKGTCEPAQRLKGPYTVYSSMEGAAIP